MWLPVTTLTIAWSLEPSCSFSSGLCISLTPSGVFCPPHFIFRQPEEPLKLFLIWREELRVITRVQQSFWFPKRFAYTHIADDRKLVGDSLYFPTWGKTARPCWKEHITYCSQVKCHAKGHAVHRRNGLISVDMLLHTVTRLSSQTWSHMTQESLNCWENLRAADNLFVVFLLHVVYSFAHHWTDLRNKAHSWRSVIMNTLLEMCLAC